MNLRSLLSWYKPYKWLFASVLAASLLLSGITLVLPLFARHLTGVILVEQAPDARRQLIVTGLSMLALVLVHTACNLYVGYKGHVMGVLMESDMRETLFAHFQRLSFRFHDNRRTGELMSRLTHDLLSMTELFHHGPEDLIIMILKFIGGMAILFSIHLRLALAVLLFLPVMILYGLHYNRRMDVALRRSKERIADINEQAEDSLAGVRVAQSFTREHEEIRKFRLSNLRFVQSRKEGYLSESLFAEGVYGFTQIMLTAVLFFGGWWILDGTLTLPDLLTYLLYIGILTDAIQRALNMGRLYREGMTGYARFQEMMEVTPEIRDAAHALPLVDVRGDIEFRHVAFRYREEGEHVLKDLSLHVRPGETIALVGPSGAGKTTLCALIPRFYDVTAGEILLDGMDIRQLALKDLRGHIGVVQQDVYLFAGSIRENIRYGKPDATDEEILAAAKQADAHDFILQLPEGYETDVGQRGIRLSGGQRQRLGIARVFLKNPPILLLDEATSALDSESENAVHASLTHLAKGRTTLLIAHRLSTIRNADRIVVLTDSGIAEEGTYAELMQKDGLYAHLEKMAARLH